jgi:type IV pilus assembly protein PilM
VAFSMFQSHAHYSLIIKDHIIRFVELKKLTPNGVRRFFEQPLPEGIIENGKIKERGKLEVILKACVKNWKIRGKKLLITVPNASAVVRTLSLPGQLDEMMIRSYLFMEIGQTIHLPFENPVFDTYLIKQKEEQTELLLFAAPEDIVKSYVDLLEACGTKPIAAEISPLSLHRLYKLLVLDQPRAESKMFVQFDQDGINVSIFNGEDLPLFMRQVSLNSNEKTYIEDPFNHTGLRYSELIAEIERIMGFYQFTINNGMDAVQKIVVTGDHSDIQDFSSEMETVLTIPIFRLYNETMFGLSDQPLPHDYQVNIGLALKEVVGK